ncbi:serine protease [Mycobacterium sp. CBMA293]|uniref:S1C family serine protease n=1 Tax=unclassified Mycolicibacterium TaxID=2636767 RepID=UPI0012DF1319|nr:MULTISPECIES: S1C family serine protease [unclassified Mycolicibacterium]MUL46702.1 serine protease [Mycolicibacterium sp. CBMA 360]MUL58997.1 serine protease [Mycolicibacterium sp. CBMA 335]MUL69391.1 serine protease [Mycolicibacterium sp. CBMA 311]MUL94355.1 serine protease [Mycolicibacterium sp. CBMA 230]MUM06629.1 serine protease [Mycolicibacterium sp. CBMA 213]
MGGFRFCSRLGTAMVAAAVSMAGVGLSVAAEPIAHADSSPAVAAVEPATARVDTVINYQHAIGAGTGFVLDPNGALLTNFHVVQGADKVIATVGGKPYRADLVGYDRHHDIAVLQLRGASGLPVAPLGDSSQLAVGDDVVALGNADGSDSALTQETGHVMGLGRTISAKDELTGSSEQVTGLIQFAAPVRAGDSGGPLVSADGHVVGMTTAATLNYRMGPGGEGFAIPINEALAIAAQIRSGAASNTVHIGQPTLLGVGVGGPDEHSQLPGVLIRDVIGGGPAQQAGVMPGDVLVSIDSVTVSSASALTSVLDRHAPGDVVELFWIDRAGQQHTGKATLTS